MNNVFSKMKETKPAFQEPKQFSAFLPSVKVDSPIIPYSVVSDLDIDKIGESVSQSIGQTTQKIIDKMVVGKFDNLGVILTQISMEVEKLDPSSIQKGGVLGWFQEKFTDLKGTLTLRLKSAETVFKDLEQKISSHITVQQEWVCDLDNLYQENYSHYKSILEEIKKVENIISYAQNQVENWPVIDLDSSDAAMNVQAKRDAVSKINRLHMKKDNLIRLKAMTETNSPKIRQQQESSRATISTLKDVITQTIPIVKFEFALFLQTLDTQKSIKLTNEVRNLASKSLTNGAESAKNAAIESTKSLNAPVISNETLQNLRNKMLETVAEVKKIEYDASVKREVDAREITNGQKSLLTALQNSGSI